MLKNLKNFSKTQRKKRKVSQPFASSIMLNAKKIADEYRIILEKNGRLGYIGSSVEIPTVFADGDTPDKCYKAVREALKIAVSTMIESGQKPPLPSSSGKRTVQVNVRLTSQEKLLLTNESIKLGFKGISDFIRSSVLKTLFS